MVPFNACSAVFMDSWILSKSKLVFYFAVVTHGPVSQQSFLHNMGSSVRLKILLQKAKTEQEKTDLLTSYRMMCNPDNMGERFKFFCIHRKDKQELPAGFSSVNE